MQLLDYDTSRIGYYGKFCIKPYWSGTFKIINLFRDMQIKVIK